MTTGYENSDCSISDSNLSGMHLNLPGMNVKVADYNYKQVNPSPVKMSKDADLLEEFLSPRKLQALTGVENLDTVEYLEMRVNTDQMSLGNFGMYLPNLTQMKLSGSYIPTIRDLGTSLWNMEVLWMPQCCLHCLDGLVTMTNMRELYLAYNEIEDISSCGMLENLEILDLEGNHIADTSNLHYLSLCPALTRLTLEGNPLCQSSNYPPPASYRRCVLESIPQLQYLDDICLNVDDTQQSLSANGDTSILLDSSMALEDHWTFINSMLVETGLVADCGSAVTSSPLSSVDSGRPSSSRPTSSSLRPMSASRRISTAGRPQTGTQRRPGSAMPSSLDSETEGSAAANDRQDDSSLTAGQVVCGNLTKSLRRHNPVTGTNRSIPVRPHTSGIYKMPMDNSNIDENCEKVLAELGQWRQDYERSRARIEAGKAPQVLTIDHAEDEIEELTFATSLKPQSVATTHASTDKTPLNGYLAAPTSSKHSTAASKTQLNPLRTNRLPLDHRAHQNSSVPATNKTMTSNATPTVPVRCQPQPDLSISSQSSVQISRIRRQLMQTCSIAPSKPLLKRP